MARTFLTSINLNKNELQNAAIQNLASAPGSPVQGQVYYDTVEDKIKVFNGSTWDTVGNTTEAIQDVVDGLIVAGTGIDKNYNDGANTLTISNTVVLSLIGTANEIDVSASTGTVTLSLPSTINADLNGNASTASTLQTARVISITGDASGSASFNGGSNISIPVTINSSSNVSSITGTANEIDVSASVGAVTISLPATINANLNGLAASATYAVTAGTANSVAANSVTLGTSTSGNYVEIIGGTDGVSVTGSGSESASVTIANTDKGSSQNIFKNIAVSGQNTVVADTNDDTLTFAGSGITITTDSGTDTVTFTNAGVTSVSFGTTGLTPNTATTGAVSVSGTLNAANGGTGQASYAIGDLLYASASTTLSKLADVATGNALISGGVGVAPSWGKIGLTTHVSGTLAVGNGGTGLSSTPTNGQLLIGNGTNYTLATLTQGSGITITNGSGSVSIANAGVISLAGTTNQVTVSASVGDVTLSLPQDIHTGANPTFAGLNAGNINVGITTDNEIDTDSGNLVIDSAGGTVTIDDNLTVTGDLTVSGSVTYLNTQTLQVSDNLVVLNYDVTGTPTENSGIEVERGTSANVSLLWNETDDRWTMTNDGTNFYAMAKKYSLTLSSSSTTYTVSHNLNDRDVAVDVYRNSAPYDTVETDVERTDANTVTLRFATAPSANEYRVVVVG